MLSSSCKNVWTHETPSRGAHAEFWPAKADLFELPILKGISENREHVCLVKLTEREQDPAAWTLDCLGSIAAQSLTIRESLTSWSSSPCIVISHVVSGLVFLTKRTRQKGECTFRGSVIKDAATSALLSWMTCSGDSQLPYYEDTQRALWKSCGQSLVNEPSWKLRIVKPQVTAVLADILTARPWEILLQNQAAQPLSGSQPTVQDNTWWCWKPPSFAVQ